jgi:hypothetical protein
MAPEIARQAILREDLDRNDFVCRWQLLVTRKSLKSHNVPQTNWGASRGMKIGSEASL